MEPSSSRPMSRRSRPRRIRGDLVERGDLTRARAAEDEPPKCRLFRCFCCWRRHCSPNIPPVMPHRDYLGVPPRLDRPVRWSVVIGCTSSEPLHDPRLHHFRDDGSDRVMVEGKELHNLRLHRFSVDDLGCVIGDSNDLLEPISHVSPKNLSTCFEETMVFDRATGFEESTEFDSAVVSLVHSSLYVVCAHRPVLNAAIALDGRPPKRTLPPKPFVMNTRRITLSGHSLPHLPLLAGSYQAVSARGRLWVPAVLWEQRSSTEVRRHLFDYQLVVYLLAEDNRSWSEFKRVNFPYNTSLEPGHDTSFLNVEPGYGGSTLQGYAVIKDRFILLSFINCSSRFFSFDCVTGDLTPVATDSKSRAHQYVPISGKGVHHEVTNTVYFIRGTKLFAYKYSPEKDEPLAPPIEIDTIWPYREEGYGFIVSLSRDILCTVWINMDRPCGCTTRHAIITTLFVEGFADNKTGSFVPSGVVILHSTCRRIDMLRSEAAGYECYDSFCFLQ
ncbi:hypothetical protein PR202_ga15475 [Eleusine coracana subsp. coracana]|uniref:Uncharacterized protein n=1 Tax=Eleusine coracana subsp. coracana TaxID=191504 RepID=A0AAV5CJS6_ELECO|nr:hypothetical protein PR202_ga15475 [Eleusine coracana subsp. coracana]